MCTCRVIQVDLYQLFGIIQRVHCIIFANDKRMSYANKLCVQTGCMFLKPSYSIQKDNKITNAFVEHYM